MASAGFSSNTTTPSISLDHLNIPATAVTCATTNAVNKMQTIADLLLLQCDEGTFTIQPLFNTATDCEKCKDIVIRNTKGLAATVRQIGHHLRHKQHALLCRSLEVLSDQVVTITEASAHMAYTNVADSIKHKPIDRYLLTKCELDITAACERLHFKYGSITNEEMLKISSGVSDNVALIKRTCLEVKESMEFTLEDKTQISLMVDAISASFVSFANCLKDFTLTPHSSECRRKCLIVSKPLLSSVAAVIQLTDSATYTNMPLQMTKKLSEPMTALLGSAMAIVSSSVRYVESAQSVTESMGDSNTWKSLVNCSKSVAESANLLAATWKDSTPFASKRNSFINLAV